MRLRGWQDIKDDRILTLYREVIENAKAVGYFKNQRVPSLYTRKNMIGALGKCYTKKMLFGELDQAILISDLMFKYDDEKIRSTIIHEVAHAVTPGYDHNYIWRNAGNRIGAKWDITVSRLCSDEQINIDFCKASIAKENTQYLYELYCPKCGKVIKRYKTLCDAVQHPHRWIHSGCGGQLESRKIEQPNG